MASSVRIDGSLPTAASASTGTVFSNGWAIDYEWTSPDHAVALNQPRRLNTFPFPPPFDGPLDGLLRGREAFAGFLYLFKNGVYLRLTESTMVPTGPPTSITAWGVPAAWTTLDAVFPGGGVKTRFAYFFHDDEYVRYDWVEDRASEGYPKKIGPNWHTTAPFTATFDGAIVGQGTFANKVYLFKTVTKALDNNGAPGVGRTAPAPTYARYDFNTETIDNVVENPATLVDVWHGLFPLLDAGPAADVALDWCTKGVNALNAKIAGGASAATDTALNHHFMSTAPNLIAIRDRLNAIRARIASIPFDFTWLAGLTTAAQTEVAGFPRRTDIGDEFSTIHGPFGRAAVMIHEAAHFIIATNTVDVPEWSGETVDGVAFGIAQNPDGSLMQAYHTITAAQAVENPSSYAAFTQEIAFGSDTRFGQARLHQ